MDVRKGCIIKGQLQKHRQNLGSKYQMVANNNGNYHLLSKDREKCNGQVRVGCSFSSGTDQWGLEVFPIHLPLPTSDWGILLTKQPVRGVGGAEKSLCSICQTLSVEHKAGTMTRARDVVKGNLAHIVKGVCFNLASFVFGPCSSQPLVFTGPPAYRPYVKTISLVHG